MPVFVPAAPSTTERQTRELIPDQTIVTAFIDNIEIRENNKRDGYYLNIKVETAPDCEWPRRWIYGMVSLKKAARWRVDELLRATGASDTDLAGEVCFFDGSVEDVPEITTEDPVFLVDTCTLLGDRVDVEVVIDKYTDPKTREERINNKVGKFLATTDTILASRILDDEDVPF